MHTFPYVVDLGLSGDEICCTSGFDVCLKKNLSTNQSSVKTPNKNDH